MMNFEEFLGKSFACECGKIHKVDVERILIRNRLKQSELDEEIKRLDSKNPLFVCDENTLEAIIDELSIPNKKLLILKPRKRVLADMTNVEKVIEYAQRMDNDLLISVGSGTINDITKYAASKLELDYICVPTAPSVDGYTSPVAPILVKNFKETFDAIQPKTILISLEILSNSPIKLIKAGVGDAMAKITARMDWLLSKIINSEYICDFTWKMMVDDIKEVAKNVNVILSRDPKAIEALIRLLINSGIAMSMVGNSRPASGAEHIVSHFIEMYYELNNELPLFHGIQVALGTLISLKAYQVFFDNFESLKVNEIDNADRKRNLEEIFGVSLGTKLMNIYLNKVEKLHKPSMPIIKKARQEISTVYQEFAEIARKVVLSLNLEDEYSKIDKDLITKAVMFSNSIRDRYTIFDLFDSLGILKDFSTKYS